MALAVDATSESGAEYASPPLSWSHTCSGSNRILIVGVSWYSSGQTVSSVTYNSVSMTACGDAQTGNSSGVQLFYLANPSAGSNTVAVTMSGDTSVWAYARSYTGASGSVAGYATDSGYATTATVTVNTGIASGDIVVDVVKTGDKLSSGQPTIK